MARDLDWVLRRRLTTQRLTATGFESATSAVGHLLCMQAQDWPFATWSVGMRVRGATYDSVIAAQTNGDLLRTHILRPTWHYVAREDLRWLLASTSPKVEGGMAARHRQLELDDTAIRRGCDALADLLTGTALTRRQLGGLADPRLPPAGPPLGHLLLVAELRGLVCSGPPAKTRTGHEHTYVLVDDVVPPTEDIDRPEAVRRLCLRFFTGHGPASARDLTRWCGLTLAEIRPVTTELVAEGLLEQIVVDEEPLWLDPATPPRSNGTRALLLPGYDEAFLTYPEHVFPRSAGPAHFAGRHELLTLTGGGIVVVRGSTGWRQVGGWRRRLSPDEVSVEVTLDDAIDEAEREAIDKQRERYARFMGRPLAS